MKSSFFTLLCLLGLAPLMAQTGLLLHWEHEVINAAGPAVVEFTRVAAVPGGSVVVGHVSTAAGIQMYAARHDGAGAVVWELTLPSGLPSSLQHLAVDAQGDLYVAGRELVLTAAEPETHLAKISGSGQLLWHHTYNGPGGLSLGLNDFVLADGGLYLCGGEEDPQDTQRGWVARFSLNGNLVWETAFDPDTYVWLGALAVGTQGQVTVVGSADDDYSFLAVQFDPTGALSWQYPATLSGNDEQWLSDVVLDAQGNVYAVGTEEVGAFFEYDIVTLKLDPGGQLLWKQNFTEGGENGGTTLRLGANHTVYTFGYKEDDFDLFAQLIAYDSTGQLLWETAYAIGGNSYPVAAELAANGDIFLAVQDFDSLGVAAFSPTGTLLAARTYGQATVDYLSDLALGGSRAYATAYSQDGFRSQLLALEQNGLGENFVANGQGLALSDVNPTGLATDGQALWLASYADDGDSASFTLSKLSLNGQLLWARTQRHETSNPRFPHLIAGQNGEVIGLYENLITGGNTPLGLVKYDAAGQEVFAHYLDSAATFVAGGLAVDASNRIYLALYNQTAKHMRLSQYDPAGQLLWSQTYLSPSTSFPYIGPFEMQVTAQNKLVMAAVEKGADNRNNLHLLQFDLAGQVEWNVQVDYQTSNLVSCLGMEVMPDGRIYVFGSSGVGTWVAACYDASGSLVWEQKAATTVTGAPRTLSVDAQGNVYLGFSTATHAYFQKRDASGGLVAEREFSVPTSGSFYLTRQSAWTGDYLVALGEHLMPGQSVPFELLLDADLGVVYSRIDSAREATPKGIVLDPAGNIYSAWAQGNQSTAVARRTALVRQYAIGTTGLAEALGASLDWQVFPNPAHRHLRVRLEVPQAGPYRFSLLDLSGREIGLLATPTLGTQPEEVSLDLPQGLSSGLYLVQVEGGGLRAYRRVVVR